MGKLVVFEWMSLDGVFDASTMSEWWDPFDSAGRRHLIRDVYFECDAFLMGCATYELLAPLWSSLPDDEMLGVAGKLTNTPKHMVSS